MLVLLSLAFLIAVIWLLARAREKGWLNLGDCPCCGQGKPCSRHDTHKKT